MLLECLQMPSCSIAFVLIKSVLRVLLMQVGTQTITVHLGQNRGSGYRGHQSISLHDRFRANLQNRESVPIDKYLDWLQT